MYDADRNFQAFVRGDLHTDGWKSQWRIDLERRMAEKPRVTAPKIIARQAKTRYAELTEERRQIVRTSANKRRLRLIAEGLCRDCGKVPAKQGRTSCDACLKNRYSRQKSKRKGMKEAA